MNCWVDEGIFFSSRAFDRFSITSEETYFSHEAGKAEDWILEGEKSSDPGTHVFMQLSSHTSRTLKSVFDEFSTDDNYGFNKTIVPVKLARYGSENLISRSQAMKSSEYLHLNIRPWNSIPFMPTRKFSE